MNFISQMILDVFILKNVVVTNTMLLIEDINNEYNSVNELLEKLVEVLNLEKIQIDKLFDEAEYCINHNYLIEAKFLQNKAYQGNKLFVKICNEILGIYF